jgi:L,D-transpeptidase YcbB
MLSRRNLLTGSIALVSTSSSAFAQKFAQQIEWQQNYDAVSRVRVKRSTTPILSLNALSATEEAINRYRDIAARGGWRPLQISDNLRVGAQGADVVALRERLIATGDIDTAVGTSSIYDSYVEAAVQHFQARHGFQQTGAMNSATLAAMNVPADIRVRQLELNLGRLRGYSRDLGDRFVIVNIPAAMIEAVENGTIHKRHAAGVGRSDRQSPLLNSWIPEVNFNPYWTVPASIIRKDLIPKMRVEPDYLTKNLIRVYNERGQELDPRTINWFSNEATRYMFRQDPGGNVNSLGFVRINTPSTQSVYMHDTPSRGIFGEDYRFVSSGCVRVQNVRDHVEWLLKETPGWTREQIDATFKSGERINARIKDRVNTYWIYITAWATPEGAIQFRDDIYNRDGFGAAIPVASRIPTEPNEETLLN